MTKITISRIKADVGGYPGHRSFHPTLIKTAEEKLEEAKKSGCLVDYRVMACGDDIELRLQRHTRPGLGDIRGGH